MKSLSKLDIIEETVAYYSSDVSRRSINISQWEDGSERVDCVYHGDNGQRCAFSRCCKEEIDLSTYEGTSAINVLERLGNDVLKEDYQISDMSFWRDLQMLHDRDCNWDDNGLTEKGNAYVEELKEKYK